MILPNVSDTKREITFLKETLMPSEHFELDAGKMFIFCNSCCQLDVTEYVFQQI